ncbi:MAG: ATP-binding protein [Deltaproteobacteria bacterium]|jgi:uncharacterized protein|nr:ATP-binding protein [Deltaproteobacteria bacterium]MBT4639155.1 ATP-binding protein [Deltaproteobacteria bacterium]MBT6501799.1 ATP-binding protein [Deltaproteobacteria bacterium]MBT7151933.1 ATP-binding protein [Deltaproteobacteria bacterium]MBT7712179.1 ATP-binding protein [Deltaproteobacteria bacterium]
MKGYIKRNTENQIETYLSDFPAVAILGPRQCGKTTLAKRIGLNNQNAIHIDLEKQSDLRKLQDPELFFQANRESLVCLDEIQRIPDLFPTLRSVIDDRNRNSQFLILGSASRDLLRQSSESLAGRIAYIELTPFSFVELKDAEEVTPIQQEDLWMRGGFPRSVLAATNNASIVWRQNFVRTFLERDIPQLGFQIPAASISRLWQMLAHQQGQLLNGSRIGKSLGVSHTTVRSYLELLSQTFMIRLLPPLLPNLKKRLVKSPKIYVRDSGVLHSLLEIDSYNGLLGHPVYGNSWEGFALENILSVYSDWNANFYRTSAGAELDLVLSRGNRRIAIEFKASTTPHLTKGFWNALEDLSIEKAWIVALVDSAYPIRENVMVTPLDQFLKLGPKDVQ